MVQKSFKRAQQKRGIVDLVEEHTAFPIVSFRIKDKIRDAASYPSNSGLLPVGGGGTGRLYLAF